ncbi:MAG: protein kinase [Acidobacteriia bacterium]|nr:protein kinase [Terriglobia bacterium]
MSTARRAPIPFPPPEDLAGSRVGRFVIRSKLGAGGMGEVYYAEDTKLQRPVALKRVSRKLRSDPEARRHILREAQRASALSSEHIASVYDVVEDLDEIFLVMEYVEGTTLRRRLQSAGHLTLDSFLHVAVQCAEALKEAQQKGIVHRDLKPENIMLTGADHVKILDFGLARRLAVGDETAMTASVESQSLGCAGTPGYMAPEALLEQEVDARADIFSLGIVFYEMLTGQHPFETKRLIGTTDHILHYEPPPMGELVGGVPEELERIVGRMLAKEPQARYASAADLLVDLRVLQGDVSHQSVWLGHPQIRRRLKSATRPGIALLLVVLALSTIPWPSKPPLPEKKHLAVLPFVPAVDDPEARAFSKGLAETLTAKLTQLTDRYPIQVVSPSEIGTLSTASVAQARSELGVNLVLEGSFHQSGSRARVVYNLVDARTQRVLRADTITADVADPFVLEDRVVESAVHALDLELNAQERNALVTHGTSQPAAYDFYLRGRGYLQEYQKPENVGSAIELFRRALERDPEFALAYAGLGETYWQKYEVTHDREWVAKALEACQRASAGGYGYACLGTVYNGTGKYEEAAAEFQRAVQADATSDDAYRGLAFAYEHMGKVAEAEQTYRSAIRVRPEYWAGYNWLGRFLYHQGRYEEAAKQFEQVTELAPDNFRGYNNLIGAYIALARYADVIPLCERSISIRPTQDAYSELGTVYFYLRRFPEAALAYERAVKMDERERYLWGNLGDAYYWVPGRRQESVAAYRKALALGEEQLRVNPRNETLLSYLAVYHAMLREEQMAWANLKQALALAPGNPEVRFNGALVANQFGDSSRAIAWLRQALDAGLQADQIRNNPNFDNLRSSKPFQELLREKIPTDAGKQSQ